MKILSLLLASVFILSAIPAAIEMTVPAGASVGGFASTKEVPAVIGTTNEATGDPGDSCVSNGFLTARVYDSTGIYTFDIGSCSDIGVVADYILFPLGTSFVTVADFGADVDYTEGGGGGGVSLGTPTSSSVVGNSIITVFPPTPEGLIVTQNITVEGDNSSNSAILMNVKVVNIGADPQEVGVRYLWDIDVGGYDGTWLQTYDDTTAVGITGYETSYSPPPANFTSYALGGCSQGSVVPPPYTCDPSNFGPGSGTFIVYGSIYPALGATFPVRFVYGWWGAMSDTAYRYVSNPSNEVGSYVPNVAGAQDSAEFYYFSNETLPGNGGGLSDQADISDSPSLLLAPPAVSLVPDSGAAGTSVMVTGAGLTPGKTVLMTSFGSLSPIPLSGSCVAGVSGTITSSGGCKFLVPPHTPTGVYTLAFSDGTHTPAANFTVTAPIGRTTKTTVSCQPGGVPAGSPTVITCRAKVTGRAPTGSVAWSQGGVGAVSFVAASCTLSMGSCSVTLTGVQPGSVVVHASYGGDSSNPAGSGTRMLEIGKGKPVVTIVCSSTTLSVGDSATCTATLSWGYLTPTGALKWVRDGGWWQTSTGFEFSTGSATFSSKNCALSSGSCSITVTATAQGSFMIEVFYPGDSNNLGARGWLLLSIVAG